MIDHAYMIQTYHLEKILPRYYEVREPERANGLNMKRTLEKGNTTPKLIIAVSKKLACKARPAICQNV